MRGFAALANVLSYWNAYQSLKVYPVTLQHPSDAQELKGFGPKICELLTKKLEEHCRANGLPVPAKNSGCTLLFSTVWTLKGLCS